MNADSRPPLAIRITRPYASEDEYLEQELDTLTRTSITLIGAQPRPEGVILRFEVVLPAGLVLLRGEGRVVGFKNNAFEGVGGLSLRFTRLDMRSKALVDRATALRDKRRPSMQPTPAGSSIAPPPRSRRPPPPVRETLEFPAPVLEAVSSSALESSPSVPLIEEAPSSPAIERPPLPARASVGPARTRPSRPPPGPSPMSREAQPSVPPPLTASTSFFPAPSTPVRASQPPDRDALLNRLRARAKGLDPLIVTSVLGERSSRR